MPPAQGDVGCIDERSFSEINPCSSSSSSSTGSVNKSTATDVHGQSADYIHFHRVGAELMAPALPVSHQNVSP